MKRCGTPARPYGQSSEGRAGPGLAIAATRDMVRHGRPDDVRGLIAVSGVQMIPDPDQPGSEPRKWLGDSLREVDPWSDS